MKKYIILMLLLLALALPATAWAANCTHQNSWTPNGAQHHICLTCASTEAHSITQSTTPATCQSVGYTMDVCTACGYQGAQYDIKNADPTAHVWGEWTTVTKPTCSTPGLKTHTCTLCMTTAQEPIPTAEHASYAVISEPTCIADGYTVIRCKNCSYENEKTDIIPRSAAYHRWSDFSVTLKPDCINPGSQTRTCQVCQATHRQEIEPTGHFSEPVTVAPTCTAGYTVDKCTVCGKETGERTDIRPAVHAWSAWQETVEPTCTTEGTSVRACKHCRTKEEKSIEPLPHDYKEGIRKPTCVSEGYTAKVCADCGKTNGGRYDIIWPSDEYHVWDEDNWDRVTEPTCTQWGLYEQGCTYCDRKQSIPIQPTGHVNETCTIYPDFTHDGYTVDICTVCHQETCARYNVTSAKMYSANITETQVTDFETEGMESAVLLTAISADGQIASVLEIKADASGIVSVDFDDPWFAENHVVRAVIRSGDITLTFEASGKLQVKIKPGNGEEGALITVRTDLPAGNIFAENARCEDGTCIIPLSQTEPTLLLADGLALDIPADKGEVHIVFDLQQ